jgi:prevent-host-death family protein
MTRTRVNVSQVRDNLSEILDRVKFGKEIVTIEKRGKPYAVMISPDLYAAFQQQARELGEYHCKE